MIRDASYWDDTFKPKKPSVSLPKKKNNEAMQDSAEVNAEWMRKRPSYLEKMMIDFLDRHNIKYEFQKIFYIAEKNNYIKQYFIADFFVPTKNTIIEVDGKFHKERVKEDKKRSEMIKKYYKKIKIIRIAWKDFHNPKTLENLYNRIK